MQTHFKNKFWLFYQYETVNKQLTVTVCLIYIVITKG